MKQAWEGTILPALRGIWTWVTQTLAPAFVNFYHGVIVPVWEGVKTAVRVAGAVLGVVFASIQATWEALARAFDWAWRYVLKPVFDAVSVVATAMWKVVGFVFNAVRAGWDVLVKAVRWAWENILRPAWDAVAQAARWLWENWLRPVFDRILRGWRNIITGIRDLWPVSYTHLTLPTNREV